MAAACAPNVSVHSAVGIALAVLLCWQRLTEAAESTAAAAVAAAAPGRQVVAAAEPALVDTVAAWPAPAAARKN